MMVLLAILIVLVVTFNVVVATTMTSEEMKRDLYYGQTFIGKIFANIFYSLAWMIKVFYRDIIIEKRRAKKTLCITIEEWLTMYDKIRIYRKDYNIILCASKDNHWTLEELEIPNYIICTKRDINKITRKYNIFKAKVLF